jgi:hypothetical protein
MWTNLFMVPLNFTKDVAAVRFLANRVASLDARFAQLRQEHTYSAISCIATTIPFRVALPDVSNLRAPIAAASPVQGLWSAGAGSIRLCA